MPDLGASEDRMVRRDRVPPVFSCYLQDAPRGCRDHVPGETGGSIPRATLCMGLFCGFFPGAGFDPRVCGLRTMSGPTGTRFWQQICNKSTRRWRASRAVETCVPSIARAQAGLR